LRQKDGIDETTGIVSGSGGLSRRPRGLQVQPVNMSVQLVGVQPMQESESVVANWTCEMGNHLHESSEGNAFALARGGRAEGLASDRAATLGNRCSAVIGTTRTRFKWSVRVPSRSEVGEGSTPKQVRAYALGRPPA